MIRGGPVGHRSVHEKEILTMADYNAHTYFGMRVLERLPAALRRQCAEDLTVFREGLYGPDPLIFLLRTKPVADHLHAAWRTESLPTLRAAMQRGPADERSFAAGYLLHQLLDEAVHGYIHAEDHGAAHLRVELALDKLILGEVGRTRHPHLVTRDGLRTAQAGVRILAPAKPTDYVRGLRRMALLADYFRADGPRFTAHLRKVDYAHARTVRAGLEEQIVPAALTVERLLG